jgi:uncharacterized membrane protein
MKTRHALTALVVAVLLTPVVLSVGMFVLIPLGIVLVAALPIAFIAGLPLLLVAMARDTEARAARAHAPVQSTVVYTR